MTAPGGTVLVIADHTDSTSDTVCAVLSDRGVDVFRFDTADFPGRTDLDAEFAGGRWTGSVAGRTGRLDLSRVRSVFCRRPRPFEVPGHLTVAERWHAATECRFGLGGCLLSLPVPYLNHPGRSADAAYKPRQLRDLAACGLTVPPTLITNSADAVRRFADDHGRLVCKSLAASVLHTGDTAHVVYTRMVTDDDLAQMCADGAGIDYAAHLFQPFVSSEYAVRLTVVGQRFHAIRIDAGSERSRIDWRSDYEHLSYERVEIPDATKAGIVGYMRSSGLGYGAFHLLAQPDGSLITLEVNPEGNYCWLEDETATPITESIADFLTGVNPPW